MVDVGTEKALEIPVQIDLELASNCYMNLNDIKCIPNLQKDASQATLEEVCKI